MNNIAIIVAAGTGSRATETVPQRVSSRDQIHMDQSGSQIPKQYRLLGDMMTLTHCLNVFIEHPGIQAIQVIIRQEHLEHFNSVIKQLNGRTDKIYPPVKGGTSRQQSVWHGLQVLNGSRKVVETESMLTDRRQVSGFPFRSRSKSSPDRVLIHDAARPMVDAALIDRILDGLERANAVIPGVPVSDTLKMVRDQRVAGSVSRNSLYQIQTPQGFNYSDLYNAHLAAYELKDDRFTDDGSIMEHAGHQVIVVDGSPENWKITNPEDVIRASRQLENKQDSGMTSTRVGSGFDVHRFVDPAELSADGKLTKPELVLCGVNIPHDRPLSGHSDADVGLHALTDAILGAISDGDIGTHFPPSDPRWKGKSSDIFLKDALNRVQKHGGIIEHVDVTLICEQPKISPYREKMCHRIAEILEIKPGHVSIKATTTEGLGFTGRGEGIAAMASATIII